MNDFHMANLAASRSHDFAREAHQHRLAKGAPAMQPKRSDEPRQAGGGRRTVRLTLASLMGRSAA